MPPVRVKFVASFSSQDPRHTVENLVKGCGSWLSHSSDRTGRLQADLQLERATTITFLDLGNSGSVMISVEVGRSSWPSSQPLVTLLPTVALMTPAEWRAGKNAKTVRMFKHNDFNSEAVKEKWDRVRIVCTHPFRKDVQFGLSIFSLHTKCEVSNDLVPGAIIVKEAVIQPPVTSSSKKEELVSKMNLPAVKKKVMPEIIGWLENKVLTHGEEDNTVPASSPFTSPVSRAARLVVMAAKPLSKSEADLHKADLEREALEFLISLKLTIREINLLKVSGVRRDFENRRKKELSTEEKVIFKDIALDFASVRLSNLEGQQEKVSVKGYVNGTGTPKHKGGKYTFKHINSSGKQVKTTMTPSPRSGKVGRQKLREEENLDFSISSGTSRNSIALADTRITTPKRSRNGKPKNQSLQTAIDGYGICHSGSAISNKMTTLGSINHSAMVECPICSGLFELAVVQSHAASCGIAISSDSDSDICNGESSTLSDTRNQQEETEKCPVCGIHISSSSLQVHASACATTLFD